MLPLDRNKTRVSDGQPVFRENPCIRKSNDCLFLEAGWKEGREGAECGGCNSTLVLTLH